MQVLLILEISMKFSLVVPVLTIFDLLTTASQNNKAVIEYIYMYVYECFRDGVEVAIVYFRTCYVPAHFSSEKVGKC